MCDQFDKLSLIVDFPNLLQAKFEITSPKTKFYNCVAWAAGEDDRFWWPDKMNQAYWPKGVLRQVTLPAFISAFQTLGYNCCGNNSELEDGFEKIAIFLAHNGKPTHVARQLADGKWTSKLGANYDISHELEALAEEHGSYGLVGQIMRRALQKN
jgi:hypothetical protein